MLLYGGAGGRASFTREAGVEPALGSMGQTFLSVTSGRARAVPLSAGRRCRQKGQEVPGLRWDCTYGVC